MPIPSEKVLRLTHEEMLEFCSNGDERMRTLERQLGTRIVVRGEEMKIIGEPPDVERAARIIGEILDVQRQSGKALSPQQFRHAIRQHQEPAASRHRTRKAAPDGGDEPRPQTMADVFLDEIALPLKRRRLSPLTTMQKEYVEAIRKDDIVFGIGPAGTGKTYLAMAMAVSHLMSGKVSRIILCRPAVEAGEKLGFLPGDMAQKFDPYVRPLWDAMYEMMDSEKIRAAIETGVIEIAPLAFMRGRTLNSSFVILDEGQNTTHEQMKMFLTRLGFESKAVITGDVTQIDLPQSQRSGLVHVQSVLKDVEGIRFINFTEHDVVRHDLVMKIIRAYDSAGAVNASGRRL